MGDTFELHTPSPEADKCWISYAADDEVTWIVVMAKYKPADGDKSNEVVVPLLVEKAAKGIEITDYVDDQICFKLNRFGRIRFEHARVPFAALMNRFVKWNPSAKKMEFDGSRRVLLYKMFDRLLVGRLVLSATAVHGAHQTAMLVREHALKKGFWSNLAVRNKVEGALRECGENEILDTSRLAAFGLATRACVSIRINTICMPLLLCLEQSLKQDGAGRSGPIAHPLTSPTRRWSDLI